MARYSLWEEPWIPVIRLPGDRAIESLRDVLVEAHELREVFDPSPLVIVGIHRLLLAVLYRIFQPESLGDWAALWKAGHFDPDALDGYGGHWSDRFDLLHPARPFYQVPLIPNEKVHPASALVMEAASGNNPTLFDHGQVEGEDSLSLDRAACHLLAYQLFALGGGVSKPFNRMDAPLTKGLVVEARGRNLFETLLLNLMPLDFWQPLVPVTEEDAPFWEIDSPPDPVREGTVPLGPMHYLTWQSRQVHLIVDDQTGRVTGCQIRQRYALPQDGTKLDPGKAYRRSDEKGWQALRPEKERAAWQYTDVLLQLGEADAARPELMDWLASLRMDRRYRLDLPTTFGLEVTGLTTAPGKAAKVDLWRREHLPLPVEFLEQKDLVAELSEMLKEAVRVEQLLDRTAQALVWSSGERQDVGVAVSFIWTGELPSGDGLGTYKKRLEACTGLAQSLGMVTQYWPALEGPFRQALEDLPRKPVPEVRKAWRTTIQRVARDSFQAGRDSLLHTEASFEVLSRVGHAFHIKLARLFMNREEESKLEHDEGANEQAD